MTFFNDLTPNLQDDLVHEMHCELFEDSMRILNNQSSTRAQISDVVSWILRPARVYDTNGRLVFDGMKTPFSFQLACKAIGVDPDLYKEELQDKGILPSYNFSFAQYLHFYQKMKITILADDQKMLDIDPTPVVELDIQTQSDTEEELGYQQLSFEVELFPALFFVPEASSVVKFTRPKTLKVESHDLF